MAKLMEMVNEDVILSERIRINSRKVRLAGIGLVSKARSRRQRLLKQMMEMGESFGAGDTLVGKASIIGTGAVYLLMEESQRLFDDLVEEGERSSTKSRPTMVSAVEKINKPKTASKSQSKAPPKKPKTVPVKPSLSADSKIKLEQLKRAIEGLGKLNGETDLELRSLLIQVTEGDVRGRRPAKTKPQEQVDYDARRKLKGLKPEQALEQLATLVTQLTPKLTPKPTPIAAPAVETDIAE